MKKGFKFAAVLLSATIMLSSCIGSFSLTNKVKDWNEGIGGKFVNELVFICMHIIPVYPITLFVDGFVLNSIEFWTGNQAISKKDNGTKIVKNSKGEDVAITTTAEGYTISNGEEEVKFLFNEAENSWSVAYNDEVTKLMTIDTENNKAELYLLNGETMDVELTDDGMNIARQAISANSFAQK
ncbi:MAG: DUF3332 domain-containing protein [Bacteroidaceae bacterium]|nr:DUF3332 domain-containing protein [Bacteroidaceae bacterium]